MGRALRSDRSTEETDERRREQARIFRRNQMLGLLLVAALVLLWGMLRAPKGWLFPPGWWRFW